MQGKSFAKGLRITDANGNQRYVRQIFLPKLWNYTSGMENLEKDRVTDTLLLADLKKHKFVKAYFE